MIRLAALPQLPPRPVRVSLRAPTGSGRTDPCVPVTFAVVADEVAELATANREQAEQVTEIAHNVQALERSLESAVQTE